MPTTVLHLTGSAVSDFLADLSLLYARDCLAATADPQRYDVQLAFVRPDGRWCFPQDLGDQALRSAPTMAVAEAMGRLRELEPDVVVPQMFCLPGMTSYRSLLDLIGLPFVGNRAEVMALAADKEWARAVVAAAGVVVPAGQVLTRDRAPATSPLPLPVVVKPVDGDNSLGVSLVRTPGAWSGALAAALAESDRVLVEYYVELGREVRCGVLELDGRLICLPLEEYAVDSVGKPIRDHADKIAAPSGGGLSLVAKDGDHAWIVDPDDPITAAVHEAAIACHVALGCRDYSLFDFRIDPEGRPWFLEAGLYCSFARQSVVSTMAEAAGIGLPELFETILRQAVSRGPGRV